MKRTKIIATISTLNCGAEFIRSLYENGMNVVRLNTAHMEVEELEGIVQTVRSVSDKIGILIDTKGPNIRTCDLAEPRAIVKGEEVRVSGDPAAAGDVIRVSYQRFADDVQAGQHILFDDGEVDLVIRSKSGSVLVCEACRDAVIRNRKSVNVPNASMKMPALTEKDRRFIWAAIKLELDFIAHSFVRNRDDVMAVRSILETANSPIQIIAKIENREGVDNVESILDAADGIMVARGDLGIEIPPEEVPSIQKRLIYSSMCKGKTVITATQMLQSMEENLLPTRAEVSDVANAVFDGTDAVMLSGETAKGKYPVEAVTMMRRIIESSESSSGEHFTRPETMKNVVGADAYIVHAAVRSSGDLPVKALVCNTGSGASARCCAAYRPRIPIYALSHHPQVVRQLSLVYGVTAEHCPCINDPLELSRVTARILLEKGDLERNDLVVLLSKNRPEIRRNNLCCIATFDELQG